MDTGQKAGPDTTRGARGELTRISGRTTLVLKEYLTQALATVEPDDRTQRQTFEGLITELYALRRQGCSFKQLTAMLRDGGFTLQVSTVRTYYTEMVARKMELCESEFQDRLAMLAEVREVGRDTELASIASKAIAIRERKKAAVASEVDAMLSREIGGGTLAVPVGKMPAAPSARGKPVEPAPAAEEVSDTGGFGLLGATTDQQVVVPPGGGFFSMGEDAGAPQVPVLEAVESRGTTTTGAGEVAGSPAGGQNEAVVSAIRSCMPLKQGVAELERRAGVLDAVYEAGQMEHPVVPGLMLSREERLYSLRLEFVDEDGAVREETVDEKRYRMKWQQPVPVARTTSGKVMVKMNKSLFAGEGTG